MFCGISAGCAGVINGRPTSWIPVTLAESWPIAWPNWVAISEPIKPFNRPPIISIDACAFPMPPKMFSPFGPLNIFGSTPASARNSSLSEPSELKAWSAAWLACDNKPASASDKPAASGSTVSCQPTKVVSTQSVRLRAIRFSEEFKVKSVLSSSQSWARSSAVLISATSFAPIGCEPCAWVNFFATSRTIVFGSGSGFAEFESSGLINPAGLRPSCSNCAFIWACIASRAAASSADFSASSELSLGPKPKDVMATFQKCDLSSFRYW